MLQIVTRLALACTCTAGAVACSSSNNEHHQPAEDAGNIPDHLEETIDEDHPDGSFESGRIYGNAQVFGRQDHSGISVRVEGTNLQTTTNPDGSFSLTDVPAGHGVLVASMDPYQPAAAEVFVDPDLETDAGTLTLRLGKLLHGGEDCLPLGFTPNDSHALFLTDFSPFVGTGSLWTHDIQHASQLQAGSGTSPMTIVLSPDGTKVALLRDIAVSTGTGHIVAVDLMNQTVHEIADNGSIDALRFTNDSAFLIFVNNVDPLEQTGALRVVSTTDWSSTDVADNVPVYMVEWPTTDAVLWFHANLSASDFTSDLYRYELGDTEPELVDTGVLSSVRWLGNDGSPVLYLAAPMLANGSGTLKSWSPGESPRTLAHGVPGDMVFLDGDDSVVFLSEVDETTSVGTLSRWELGPDTPVQLALDVQSGAVLTEDGSTLVYVRDPDPVTSQGSLALWSFETDQTHDLGPAAGPWRSSRDGSRIAYFANFDLQTQLGSLFVFDTTLGQSTLVEQGASSNVIELEPSGSWLAYQRNPIDGTFMGDLWLYDIHNDQRTLLAEQALPVVRWSPGATLVAFFVSPDAPFVTALGTIRSLSTGQIAQLGRISFLADHLRFSNDEEVTFFRNPASDASGGDLWVWDAAKDPWSGSDLGKLVLDDVLGWSIGFHPDGLLLTSDVSADWTSSTLTWWSRTSRSTTVLGTGILPDSATVALDGSRVLFFTNIAYPRGDLHVAELSDPVPVLLSEQAHFDSLWVDDSMTRALYVAGGSGDLGDMTIANLPEGTARVLATDAPFFGIRLSPDGSRISFSHDWDPSRSVGNLTALDVLTPDAPPIPIDDEAPLTHLVSKDHVLFVVQAAAAERSGIYVAPVR